MTENNTIDDASTLDGSTQHEGGSKPLMGASKSNFWWPWDSGEDRRKRLIARDHFLTLAQETAVALKAARLELKMTISDIESLTFVNAQILESIEQGQWERLPARVYSRGATFNYATAVGLTNPNTHADNISNVLNKPSHLSPSIGLMKKRSRNVQELRIEIISLAALIILAIGFIVWFQNNYSITELLNLESANDEPSNIIDLTHPMILSVMHPRALRYKPRYTQSYEYTRRGSP